MFDATQLPILYNEFSIKQGMTWDADKNEMTFHNYLVINRMERFPKYINKECTKHLIPLGGAFAFRLSFKSVKNAQKEIDAINSLGWYWADLCEREQEYIKKNMDMFCMVDENNCGKKIIPTPAKHPIFAEISMTPICKT